MSDDTQTLNTAIEEVYPAQKPWVGQDGNKLAFIEVSFTDGSMGSIAAGWEKQDEYVTALQALIGKDVEWTVKDKGQYRGTQQWQVKGGWPGKPGGSGSGGRGGGGLSSKQASLLAASNVVERGASVEVLVAYATALQALFFPQSLQYAQDQQKEQPKAEVPAAGQATLAQTTALKRLGEKLGWHEDELFETVGVKSSLNELSHEEAANAIAELQSIAS